jgi:hypothetical protein
VPEASRRKRRGFALACCNVPLRGGERSPLLNALEHRSNKDDGSQQPESERVLSKQRRPVRSQVLIDAIVRQTTVLIARLSTSEGARSPLGHIANEVFAGLVGELENQGVSKKVIADMFGMALRSYRQKVQRLAESVTSRGVTLWSAVQSYLTERESTTRAEVLQRFKHDDEISVRGILNDLVENGFVIRSGRGEETRYRTASEDELRDFGAGLGSDHEGFLSGLVWLQIYREGPMTLQQLCQTVPFPSQELVTAVAALAADGRVSRQLRDGEEYLAAEQLLIPVGEPAGWEAAIVDHHRAVLNAIAAKVTSGTRVSATSDEVGGTTLTFDLWPGHPKEEEVRRFLATTRATVLPLWEEVTEFNKTNQGGSAYQVHVYFGQYVVAEDDLT